MTLLLHVSRTSKNFFNKFFYFIESPNFHTGCLILPYFVSNLLLCNLSAKNLQFKKT